MSRLRSFITLLWILVHSLAMPLADSDDSDDDDDNGCGSDVPQQVQLALSTSPVTHPPDGHPTAIPVPYERPPIPHPSHSQHPHATLPVLRRSHTPAILGTVLGILIALVAFFFTVRYVFGRRRIPADTFKNPPKPRFTAFRLGRSPTIKKRLSDESWVSPTLPSFVSPGSPLSQDPELHPHGFPKRKLVPVTTPVCTPTDTEFGSHLEFSSADPGPPIPVPLVRVPSPVYIPPFSPSPSLSSSSSLSPAPSTEPLSSPSTNPTRLSRLLSSTFSTPPARPTTAHLIQTARSYAQAYRPISTNSTSLYVPPTPSVRPSGTRSRTGFYLAPVDKTRVECGRLRDTFSTVTTSDTDTVCTVPHLLSAVAENRKPISPFADPNPNSISLNEAWNEQRAGAPTWDQSLSISTEGREQSPAPMGTPLCLKLRLSDASEHARYRLREKQRERERQQSREGKRELADQRLSTESQTSMATATDVETLRAVRQRSRSLEVEDVRREFKLRDSESVLREIGW